MKLFKFIIWLLGSAFVVIIAMFMFIFTTEITSEGYFSNIAKSKSDALIGVLIVIFAVLSIQQSWSWLLGSGRFLGSGLLSPLYTLFLFIMLVVFLLLGVALFSGWI